LRDFTIQLNTEPKSREAGKMKTIKYIGLDVHKKFITIVIADQGRESEARYYGNISNSRTGRKSNNSVVC